MTEHLSDVELRAFGGGRMASDDLLRADDHLSRCEECRTRAVAVTDATAHARYLQARLKMPEAHLSDDEVQLFVQRRLRTEATTVVAQHLERCAECAAQVADLRAWATPVAPRRLHILAMAAAVMLAIVIPATIWQTRSHRPPTPASLAGLDTLAADRQRSIRAALVDGSASLPPFMAELAGPRETLMGRSLERRDEFEVVAPVATGTISDTPMFEWRPVAGASGYVVTVADERTNVVLRSAIVTTTTWTAATRLPRGVIYVWQVAARRGGETLTAPAAPAPPARFRVVDAEDAYALRRAERDHPASHLLLGILAMNAGIRDEAIRQLERVSPEDPHADVARRSLERLRAIDQP